MTKEKIHVEDKLNLNINGFEGPLDLLLELSKSQKVDITKLSILELANQYLEYIKKNLKSLNLSADYLVMASFLALLKSRLLLPKDEINAHDDLEVDFTKRLLHYNAIKIASEKIQGLFQEDRDFFTRKISESDYQVSNKVVINATLYDLLKNYLAIKKTRKKLILQIQKDKFFTVDDAKSWLNFFFNIHDFDWKFLLDYLPKSFESLTLKKSATASILMTSLIYAQKNKLEITQNSIKKIHIRIRK